MKERFLVTGALGCIGAWTIKLLLAEGAEVVGYDLGAEPRRLREIASEAEIAPLTLLQGDIADKQALERLLDEREITNVVHLAALQIPFCREDPALGALVNVVGTVNVFEAVKRRRDRLAAPVVYASSAACYGAVDTAAETDEEALAHPSTHYGVYKQANEGGARIYWQDEGVPSVGLRPYNVYGPARDQGVTAAPTIAIEAALRGEAYRIPYGGRLLFNYVPDVARALIAASRSGFAGAGVFNMPGTTATMREVVDAIEAAAPEARGLVEFDEVPLPLPETLAVGGLERAIGPVRVTPLPDGIAATVEHFRRRLG